MSHRQRAPGPAPPLAMRQRPSPGRDPAFQLPVLVQPCWTAAACAVTTARPAPARVHWLPVKNFTRSYVNLKPHLRWYEWGSAASARSAHTRRIGANESPLTTWTTPRIATRWGFWTRNVRCSICGWMPMCPYGANSGGTTGSARRRLRRHAFSSPGQPSGRDRRPQGALPIGGFQVSLDAVPSRLVKESQDFVLAGLGEATAQLGLGGQLLDARGRGLGVAAGKGEHIFAAFPERSGGGRPGL